MKAQAYFAIFLVVADDGEPEAGPETTGVGFYAERELPELSPGHHIEVPLAFRLYRNEVPAPYFDPPSRSGQRDASTSLEVS